VLFLAVLAIANGIVFLTTGTVRGSAALVLISVPGYALTTVLFPARPPTSGLTSSDPNRGGIADFERAALSVGLSVGLVPVFALVLAVASVPFTLVPVMAVFDGFAAVVFVLGLIRRARTPSSVRYVFPFGRIADNTTGSVDGFSFKTGLNVALVVVVVLASSSLAYAVVSPHEQSPTTQAALLVEQENGSLVASEYPTEYRLGETGEMTLRVTNREKTTVDYTVVVVVQRVSGRENGTVTEQARLTTSNRTLEDGQTWLLEHRVKPQMVGKDLRLAYLVFRGEAPANPSIDDSYRSLTLYIDVVEG
jgi:uncharacterized membrane protein